jgi:hypothetical protein
VCVCVRERERERERFDLCCLGSGGVESYHFTRTESQDNAVSIATRLLAIQTRD